MLPGAIATDTPVVSRATHSGDLAGHSRGTWSRPFGGLKFMRTLWVCDVAGGPFTFTVSKSRATLLGREEAHRERLAAFAAHRIEVTQGSIATPPA